MESSSGRAEDVLLLPGFPLRLTVEIHAGRRGLRMAVVHDEVEVQKGAGGVAHPLQDLRLLTVCVHHPSEVSLLIVLGARCARVAPWSSERMRGN